MKPPRKSSGFILLAAIALLPLVSIGIGLLTRYTHFLIEQTQYRTLQAEARNLAFSAHTWVCLHKQELLAAPPQQTWTLEPDSIPSAQGCCRITRLSGQTHAVPVELEAVAQIGRRKYTFRQLLILTR